MAYLSAVADRTDVEPNRRDEIHERCSTGGRGRRALSTAPATELEVRLQTYLQDVDTAVAVVVHSAAKSNEHQGDPQHRRPNGGLSPARARVRFVAAYFIGRCR